MCMPKTAACRVILWPSGQQVVTVKAAADRDPDSATAQTGFDDRAQDAADRNDGQAIRHWPPARRPAEPGPGTGHVAGCPMPGPPGRDCRPGGASSVS
jgi:hypothetical protein